jgi:hypothetical protein
MRRAFASLLLVLFSFPLILPALRSDDASNLPACCRRAGQHHCAMPDEGSPSDGLSSIAPRCPLYPASGAALVSFVPAALTSGTSAGAPVCVFQAASQTSQNIPQIALRGSELKRGPPSFID